MRLKYVEQGTFWVLDNSNGLPPVCEARVETEFEEVTTSNIDDLVVAMDRSSLGSVRRRLQNGRRCFLLKVKGQTAAYGWVTLGPESVGELERDFNLQDDEAYVWDCVTQPRWRQKRLYSSLLSRIIYQLHADGVPCIWIGASRQNRPSVQGFKNAGFEHVLDLDYRRYYRLIALYFRKSSSASTTAISAAYSIILQDYERRFGNLAVGWYPH